MEDRNRGLYRKQFKFWILLGVIGMLGGSPASAQDDAWRNEPPRSTGIAVGQKIPAFSVPDQNGRSQTFDSIKGPNGAAIYFNRSVDW